MNTSRNLLAIGLTVTIAVGGIVQAANHIDVTAATSIDLPGSITGLPAAPPETFFAPLALSQTHVSSRQALDAAEAWSGSTDSDVDRSSRAVPAVVSVGQNPLYHNMKAWVVTINADTVSHGPVGSPKFVSHKLCIVIDALTGHFIMAFNAGPENPLRS
ncbi:MAG TPA: hypothetical protein VFE42_19915 [Chloroflexota bacterium]|nr:hypothetical protein [Chloroflexota bacterium]